MMTPTDELALHLVKLTMRIASHYRPGGLGNLDELFSAGLVGAGQSFRDFRPDGGLSFRNFAALCIRRAILEQIRSERRHPLRLFHPETLDHDFASARSGWGIIDSQIDARIIIDGCELEEDQAVLGNFYLEEKSTAEIARAQGRTERAINLRRGHALRRITERMNYS